jgi:acetoin utilization protein AcuB
MLVKDRMHHPVITVYPETSMPEALNVMHEEQIRRLPVVNKRGQLVGIISENDILKASPSEATTLSVWEIRELTGKISVEEIMTKDVVTVPEDTPLEEAARVMADCEFSALPVMQDGKLAGIITETDMFKAFLEMLGGRETGVRITVMVPRGPGQIAQLTKVIFELGGDIIALATSTGDTSETGQITVKVAGVDKDELVNRITPVVQKIVDVRDTRTQ